MSGRKHPREEERGKEECHHHHIKLPRNSEELIEMDIDDEQERVLPAKSEEAAPVDTGESSGLQNLAPAGRAPDQQDPAEAEELSEPLDMSLHGIHAQQQQLQGPLQVVPQVDAQVDANQQEVPNLVSETGDSGRGSAEEE